jgi:hypothetical protein
MTFEELRKLYPHWLPSQVYAAETAWDAAIASRDEEVRMLVEALRWCLPRLDGEGLRREGMGRYPDMYDTVNNLTYLPQPKVSAE